jgi:hypothetical protein
VLHMLLTQRRWQEAFKKGELAFCIWGLDKSPIARKNWLVIEVDEIQASACDEILHQAHLHVVSLCKFQLRLVCMSLCQGGCGALLASLCTGRSVLIYIVDIMLAVMFVHMSPYLGSKMHRGDHVRNRVRTCPCTEAQLARLAIVARSVPMCIAEMTFVCVCLCLAMCLFASVCMCLDAPPCLCMHSRLQCLHHEQLVSVDVFSVVIAN